MSTHIVGFHPPDEVWEKMKQVWDTCAEAGIEPPERVLEFFDYEPPDDAGVTVELAESPAVRDFNNDSQSGYEVDIRRLPSDVHLIRFYNSW
jgi:hypothetical protein